ncbi:MAG: SNF2-related protein, partial [Chitinophagaceae bacterium]
MHNDALHTFLKELPDETFGDIIALSNHAIYQYFTRINTGFYAPVSNPWANLPDQYRNHLRKYYLGQLFKLWPYLATNRHVFQLKAGSLHWADSEPAHLSTRPIECSFLVKEDERFIVIFLQVKIGERKFKPEEVTIHSSGIFIIDNKMHLPANIEDLDVMDRFRFGQIKIPVANKSKVITEIIPLLEKNYYVEVPEAYKISELNAEPLPQIVLKEYNKQYLLIQPQFRYEGVTLDYESSPEDLIHELADGSWQTVKRDRSFENTFNEKLRLLHPLFERQRQNDFYYLPFADVMKKAWFIQTIRQLQSEEVTVMGMQELKNFRYNPNPPKWEIKAGSDIDWFDLRIKLSFGSQDVPLKDVRRALITRQNIVLLGDGTMGVLPEEWLKKFSLLMNMGEEKDGNLRVSKLHFTLIDELHDQIDNEKIREDIQQKKQKLLTINDIKTVKLSRKIKASLRPYQLSGFQWLQVLDEMGWGGCLADDMGLGKTLQAISFLQFVKEKYKKSTSLVVCPTSLIYNWEAEIQKFAPSLRYHIYYGSDREFNDEHFEEYDLIITSYGLVRNDLEHLLQFSWHYVVLDESQAIKNPNAQTTRAVQLLKSKNRLILSGTPLQNNTYDLYSQFNFINPGLLGTKEFFREFANGIDKFNEADKSSQLRKLIYHF